MRWIAAAMVLALVAAGCAGPAETPSSTTKATTKPSTTGPATSATSTTVTTATSETSSATTTVETETLGATGTEGPGPTAPPPPPDKPTFACPDGPVEEDHATHGSDATLPELAWAALKTGTRFAIMWSSAAPTTGSLRYSVQGGGFSTLTETVPTQAHVFVLDGFPQDGTICFEASEGGTKTRMHAARLSNAMFAFDERDRVYTINLSVLANEGADLAEIQAGADRMAEMVYDSTDGWIRLGNVLVVAYDYAHHNVGYVPCFLLETEVPPCVQYWDTLFTHDADPRGAASTYRKGIRNPADAIWMNQYHQAMTGPIALDDTGSVWTHELGHYAFDMDDLYGNVALPEECYDSSTGISIMAGSRDATEFDDPVAPCTNMPAGYTTSWELMQGEFPRIPDRPAGPVKGPGGDGGVYQRFDYEAI